MVHRLGWLLALSAIWLSRETYAFGFLPNIENKRHLLSFVVIERSQINFCIRIDDDANKRFFDESMEYEIREAIDEWLRVVPEFAALKANIDRVSCENPRVNLLVNIGASPTSNPAMASTTYDPARTYILITINTGFRYVLQSQPYETVDFAYFDRIRNPQSQAYRQFIQRAGQQHLPPWEVADVMRREGIRGIESPEQIRYSSYPMLLHEVGHAFGLCDTATEEISHCDDSTLSGGLSSAQPGSVMKSNGFLYLAEDDIRGITALVRAHEGGPYCLKDLHWQPPSVKTVVPSFNPVRKRLIKATNL